MEEIFKEILLKYHLVMKSETCVELFSFSGSVDSGLFKSFSLGLGWGHNETGLNIYLENIFEDLLINSISKIDSISQ